MAPEVDIGLLVMPKFQHGDMHSNISQIKFENRKGKLLFIKHHYQQCLEENITNDNWTYNINMKNNNTDDTIESNIFEISLKIYVSSMKVRTTAHAALRAIDRYHSP